jgi:UTP:GlnB (protein PII) uridylyltransferase
LEKDEPVLDDKDEFERFLGTMPQDYRASYSNQIIELHRKVCERRGSAGVNVGIFETRRGLVGLCIAAEDRAGLLAMITEAFLVCGLDVVAGDTFTRNVGNTKEAVDLFWVRSPSGADVGSTDVDKLRSTLLGLSASYATPVPPALGGPLGRSNSTVRFIEDENGALATLEVETEDRSGLLLALSRALHAQRAQIVRSEVRTEAGRVLDRFVITEADGTPVGAARRLEIQVAVLSATEPAKRLTSSPPPPVV